MPAAPRQGEVPYSAEAEAVMIGCLLVDSPVVWRELAGSPLTPTDFFLPEHRNIWSAALWLREHDFGVDSTTIVYGLEQTGLLDQTDQELRHYGYSGVEPYLVELWGSSFSAIGCSAYARILRDYAERRLMLEEGQRLTRQAFSPQPNPPRRGWVQR